MEAWRENVDRLCEQTDGVLNRATDLVDAWKEVATVADEANQQNAIQDDLAIGDCLIPYVVASNTLLLEVDQLRLQATDFDCGMNHATDFRIALDEMAKIAHYFQNWPSSNDESVSTIREEFARGESRSFQELLDEVRARRDASR